MKILIISILFLTFFLFSECAHHYVIPFSSEKAIESLNEQSQKIQTARGRAWVSVKAPEGKFSFPAVLAIDRTHLNKPLFRLEAIDLLGSTHVLLVLDKKSRLTWIDYDHKEVTKLKNYWYGLPLTQLPNLILGVSSLSLKNSAKGPVIDDSFEVRIGKNKIRYLMTWIDPGPRLTLAGLEGTVTTQKRRQEKYIVNYSHFLDHHDFYLPREEEIFGYNSNATKKPIVEIHIAWRERHWNEKIAPETFNPPKTDF